MNVVDIQSSELLLYPFSSMLSQFRGSADSDTTLNVVAYSQLPQQLQQGTMR